MRDIGGTLIDQLERFCFKHEAEEFLIWFCFKNDGFSVKAIVQEHFIGSEISESPITKHQSVVDVSNVSNEEVMVGKELVKGDGPDLFTDGDNHQT